MKSQTLGTLGRYLIVFVVVMASVNLAAYDRWQAREHGRLNLLSKRDIYLAAPETYGVVFFGDSRTFCGFHPDALEAMLGVSGYNLSFWANWLPTQYAYLEDVAPHIPPGTVLVWSLGQVNFTEGKIRPVYPIGWPRLWSMLALGFRFSDLRENLFAYTPVLWVFGYRDRIMEEIEASLARPLWPTARKATQSVDARVVVDDLVRRHGGVAKVADTEVYRDGADLASVALYQTDGSYLRVEIKPEYYRRLQQKAVDERPPAAHSKALTAEPFTADPRYWQLFLKSLDVLQRNGVRVVLNEIEEAPHHYPSPAARDAARAFMRDTVRAEALRRGIPYIRADFDRLKDSDYFDYNHLNSVGVAKYTKMIAPLLKPYVDAASGSTFRPGTDAGT